MKKYFLFILACAIFYASPASAVDPLIGLKGEKRILLLFSKSRSDATLDRQVDWLRDYRSNLREHDMIVLRTSGREETRAAIGYTRLDRGTARDLRERFKPAAKGLTVILIDKDGSEKARWQHLVPPETIFSELDKPADSSTEDDAVTTTN